MRQTFQAISSILSWARNRSHGQILAAVILLATMLLGFRSIDDLDYGIHLGTGRWILQHGRVPTTDPFTWSIPGNSYVAYHWGFQVIVAALYNAMGHLGPVLLRFVLVALTALALTATLIERRVEPLVAGTCGLLALIASELRFAIRPELFSNLFAVLTILLLERARTRSNKELWLLPIIFVGWVNTHIYILGFIILGAAILERFLLRQPSKQLLLATVLCGVAIFVNPYGLDAVMEPLRLFTRMGKDNIFAQNITELASPFQGIAEMLGIQAPQQLGANPSNQLGSWLVLLALAAISVPPLIRSRKIADTVILVLFGALSGVAVRNISLFCVVGLPAIGAGLSDTFSTHLRQRHDLARRGLSILTFLALILCLRVSTGAWYASQRRALHLSPIIERSALGVGAAEFIESHALIGRGFNNLNIGGALLFAAPSHPIYIDGRNEVTGESFFRHYLEILQGERFDSFAQSFDIEYIALGHSRAMPLIRQLLTNGRWSVAYYDAVAIVFVRKDGPNGYLPPAPLPAPIQNEEDRWAYLNSIDPRPNVIDSLKRWLLGGEEMLFEKDRLGTFLLTAGRWAEAERPLLESAVAAPNFWETSSNLGALYVRMKLWEESTHVYQTVLMLNPWNVLAKERLETSWTAFKQNFAQIKP